MLSLHVACASLDWCLEAERIIQNEQVGRDWHKRGDLALEVGMESQTFQVRAALMQCDAWHIAAGKEIRQLTERMEVLWFNVDDLVSALEEAEAAGDTEKTDYCLQALLRCAFAIQTEAEAFRA